jgi:hypothetical protein
VDPIAHYITMFAGHTLAVIVDDRPVKCWSIRPPNITDFNSVMVTATPAGVVLQRIDRKRGMPSDIPLTGFVGELDPGYLAEKFLTKQWTRESAARHFEALIRKLELLATDGHEDAAESAAELRRLRLRDTTMFDSHGEWEKNLASELDSLIDGIGRFDDPMIDASDRTPPLEYVADDVARLTAIHGRFRDLFMAAYRLEDGEVVKREV